MLRRLRPTSRKARAASLSVGSNTALVIGKLVVGIATGSVSIIAEAIHSGIDLIAALIAWVSVRIADRPADRDHPYGHGKAESISGAVEAALIVLAAFWIIIEAAHRLHVIWMHEATVSQPGLGVLVMGISVVVNILVSRYLFRVAHEEDSLALEADAHHLSTDVMTSVGVMVGLFAVMLTGWQIIDPIVALIVALFIGKIGLELSLTAGAQLMDRRLPSSELAQVRSILDACPEIHSWHNLRTRKAGSHREVDLHLVFPAEISLVNAHVIADRLEKQIAQALAPAQVVVHMDPYDPDKIIRPSGSSKGDTH